MSKSTALHRACADRKVSVVKRELRKSDDVDKTDGDGNTALHIACSQVDFLKGVGALLEGGADVNARGCRGRTPLMFAVRDDHVDTVTSLLQRGAKLNVKDEEGRTALHYACRAGLEAITKLLLANSASAEIADIRGRPPLYLACAGGSRACVEALLRDKAPVNHRTETGKAALHKAASAGCPEVVRLLLRNDWACAEVDPQSVKGYTPLYKAVKGGHAQVVGLLIAAGADPNLGHGKGGEGTPLGVAVTLGHTRCADSLLNTGKVKELTFPDGTPYIHHALRHGFSQVALLLAADTSQVNVTDGDGLSALYWACHAGEEGVVERLLVGKAGLGAGNPRECQPLYAAVSGGHDACVRRLLEAGTPVEDKATLVATARGHGHGKVRVLLEEHAQAGQAGGAQSCAYQNKCTLFMKSLGLSEVLFERKFNMCYCDLCCRKRKDKDTYKRGSPPKIYSLPKGWCKFALRLPPKAEAFEMFKTFHVAFHGTTRDNVKVILESDLLMAGDNRPDGRTLQPPKYHYGGGIRTPEGHEVKQLFVSPSILYAGREVYAKKSSWIHPSSGQHYSARVAFQVRIRPDAYKVGPETLGAKKPIDPHFSNSELEWSTDRRCVHFLVGLLVKLEVETAGGRVVILDEEPRPPAQADRGQHGRQQGPV